MVWFAPTPAVAPVDEAQLFAPAVPEIFQEIVPPGALAPIIPETVAVKVTLSPKTGEAGDVVIAMLAVALVTVTLTGAGDVCEE